MAERTNVTLANLSPQQVKLLKAIRRKYYDEWGQWLEKLMWSFSDKQGNPREGREEFVESIDMLRGYVKMIGRLIDQLMSKYAISGKQMTELFGAIREVKERIAEMIQVSKKDREIQKDMEELQEETGVSFEGMEETHKLAGRQLKALKAPRRESRFPVPEPLKQLGAGIGRGIETALLGPFAPLVEQAGGAISGFVREFKERRARKGARRLAEGLGGTPEEAEALESGLLKEQRPSPFKQGALSGGIVGGKPSRENIVERGMGKSSVGVRAASGSLFEFFDSLAFKAKWTKKLLEAVVNIAGEGPVKGQEDKKTLGKLSATVQGAIASSIGFAMASLKFGLLKVLPVALAGAVGWAVGSWLNKWKFGDKTIGERVTGGLDAVRNWHKELPSVVAGRYDKEASPKGNVAQRMGELSQMEGFKDLPDDALRRYAADDLERRGIITSEERMDAYATATRIKQFRQRNEAGDKLGQLGSEEPKEPVLPDVARVQSYDVVKTPKGTIGFKEPLEQPDVSEETIGEVALSAKALEGERDKELLGLLHRDNEEVIASIKKMIAAYEKQKEIAIGESGEESEYDVDPLIRSVSEGGLF